MKSVIVTGANGFLGSTLINRLVEEGIKVLAIDVSFISSHLPESTLIKTIETFITDLDDLFSKKPQGEYDAFYHFAWAGVNGTIKSNPIAQIKNIEMAVLV